MTRAFNCKRLWTSIKTGAALLCLVLFVTGCAQQVSVQRPEPVQCKHPRINPSTNAGMARAVLSYQEALDTCAAWNGYPQEYNE